MKRFSQRSVTVALAAMCVLVAGAWGGRARAQDDPCANPNLSDAQKRLCAAYCRRCLDEHPGRVCDLLRDRWERLTGQELFPCDPTRRLCGLDAANGGTCGGECPDNSGCVANADGTACYCERRCGFDTKTNICGGACPAGSTCLEGPNGCRCAPPPALCGFISADATDPLGGSCGGACPAGEACVGTPDGCVCQPPPCGPTTSQSGSNAGPRCGGACANLAETCVGVPNPTDGRVDCGCKPLGCGTNPFTGQCGGACEQPGWTCNHVPGTANGCTCTPPPQPCGEPGTTGQCGGACDQPGWTCSHVPGTDKCACEPPPRPCGETIAPECGGACPAGLTCKPESATANACVCKTASCDANACGTACQPPRRCVPNAAGVCQCQ